MTRARENRDSLVLAPQALTYRRVSTEEQAREGLSLESQRRVTRGAIVEHGWLPGGEFEDVLSGIRADRPGYQALLAEVGRLRRGGATVVVVVAWLDRFGRSLLERARATEALRHISVPIYSVMDGGLEPELVDNLLAAVAEEEVRRMGSRSRETRAFLDAAGWFFPTRAAWGYRFRLPTPQERRSWAPAKVLERDAATSSAVAEIWRRAAEGTSLMAIARWAQALPEAIRAGHKMSHSFIYGVLTKPTYVARSRKGPTEVLARPRGRWPALATDEQWTVVQSLIANHRRPSVRVDPHTLLRGLISCPSCGAPMKRRHESATGVARYACRGAFSGYGGASTNCNTTILASAIERPTLAAVKEAVRATRTEYGVHARRGSSCDSHAQRGESSEAAQLRAALDLVDGRISVRQYSARSKLAIAATQASAANCGFRRVLDNASVASLRHWERKLDAGTPTEQHNVLWQLLLRVVPIRQRPGVYSVALTWAENGQAALAEKGRQRLRVPAAAYEVRGRTEAASHGR